MIGIHPDFLAAIEDPERRVVAEQLVREMLEYIGEDPERPGLKDTPKRVVKAWREIFSGYSVDPDKLFTIFDEPNADEMVILRDIEFVSYCEHHFMPFTGTACIAYIPKHGRVVGISKLARLLDCFCKRLQIQERICWQVVDALTKYLNPLGAVCVLKAKHSCISCRGVGKQGSVMITSAMTGVFRKDPVVRDEFLRMAGL